MSRIATVAASAGLSLGLAFTGGWVGHDKLAAMLPWLPVPDSPPQWISDYAKAFCSGDTAAVTAAIDESLEVSREDVEEAFSARKWACDSVRYLGASNGQRGTAYIYVLQDNGTGLQYWWVFTVKGEKVVRID